MPKEEWGVKRVCPKTGKRFYDLGRTPIISPYTGEVVELETAGRKLSVAAAAPSKEKRKPSDDAVAGEDELLVDDASDELDVDDELLEDEDDDNVALDDLADVADDSDED